MTKGDLLVLLVRNSLISKFTIVDILVIISMITINPIGHSDHAYYCHILRNYCLRSLRSWRLYYSVICILFWSDSRACNRRSQNTRKLHFFQHQIIDNSRYQVKNNSKVSCPVRRRCRKNLQINHLLSKIKCELLLQSLQRCTGLKVRKRIISSSKTSIRSISGSIGRILVGVPPLWSPWRALLIEPGSYWLYLFLIWFLSTFDPFLGHYYIVCCWITGPPD